MNGAGIQTKSSPAVRWHWALGLVAAAVLWFDPSSGIATAILLGGGLYGLCRARKTCAAWRNPAGILFVAGALWAVLSASWSFYPAGSLRDLAKTAPLALAVLAVPAVFDRPDRVWAALLASAATITATLAVDLARIFALLGWPWAFSAARFLHPYLYTHPNVSSMMAGLCALVFAARALVGAKGWGWRALLALGIAIDLFYLVVLASRGPQATFALVVLAFPVALLPGWRARLGAAVLAVALGWGLWQCAGHVNPRFRDRTMASFNDRDTVWGHSKMLADRKSVAGYGFGKKAFVKAFYENPDQRPPLVPVRYPHAHSYWLMLYFQGGAIGFGLWSAGWLALAGRLLRCAACHRGCVRERFRDRVLPALLLAGIAYVLVYGVGDFPDSVIRASLFYFIGLALALTQPPPEVAAA